MPIIRNSIAGLAALSLAATPVLAQSSAGALSLQPAAERAGAPISEDSSELRGGPGGFIVPGLAVVIIVLGVLLATDSFPFNRRASPPRSP